MMSKVKFQAEQTTLHNCQMGKKKNQKQGVMMYAFLRLLCLSELLNIVN